MPPPSPIIVARVGATVDTVIAWLILRLIASGLSNGEIAHELYISDTTVKTHVAHILQKLNLRDRIQAVVLAYQTGLFEADTRRPSRRDEGPLRTP